MSVVLNLSGANAADAIVKGALAQFVVASSTMDAASVDAVAIDPATGAFVNSVLGSLSPAAGVTTRGTAGTYTHASRTLLIGSSAGLAAGDFVWVNHGSITAKAAEIESIPNGSSVILLAAGNPFTADATNVSFQVAWRYQYTAGTAPSVSSAGGSSNFLKARLSDSAGNQATLEEVQVIKDQPVGAAFVSLQGQAYNGGATIRFTSPVLAVLSSYGANNGGITAIALANNGSTGLNTATWGDATTAEKTFAQAISSGLTLTGGDGAKSGRLVLKTRMGAPAGINVDWAITLDTVGPSIVFTVAGR